MSNYINSNDFNPPQHINNKYIYVKQNILPSKVLVNPNFNKTVFVNPNFRPSTTHVVGNIHINPNVKINLPTKESRNIHVNPKILKTVINTQQLPVKQSLTYSTPTKLVRRTSVYSKYKIIKSSALNKSPIKNKLLFKSKYKLKRVSHTKIDKIKGKSRFKLDNRSHQTKSKYVFINRFLNISDLAKKVPLRTKSLIDISGILYKSSPNRLTKTSPVLKNKFVRFSTNKLPIEKKKPVNKLVSRYSCKKLISPEKLKKCNVPCPYYRKLGRCKGKELGKCPRKHDPDQIALCTKFLQGACIDTKCLLSHNVSPEKMPTCKYYLEGTCSKDNCPYMHIRISPKADICRDFLEGFCKKAAECDKRHQFLCPDYEKKGVCQKSRCSYPHGRMVRKYSVFDKYKFAKKSSSANDKENQLNVSSSASSKELIEKEKARYYKESVENGKNSDQKVDFKFRSKLGDLPTFISFDDT